MKDDIYENIIYMALQEEMAMKVAGLSGKSIDHSDATIMALSRLESEKDLYTLDHSEHVSLLALKIAEARGIKDKKELDTIRKAGLLHDVGKIMIDEEILSKTTTLTEEEFNEIKKHPRAGANIISRIKTLGNVAYYVLSHHERWDGKGYPEGLKGNGIPLGSRIISIADAIESMFSDRPYRRGLSLAEIKNELKKESGKQFDPILVKIALGIFNSVKDKKEKLFE